MHVVCLLGTAGLECCSKKWVSTHYITPEDQRRIDDMETAQCSNTHAEEWPFIDASW